MLTASETSKSPGRAAARVVVSENRRAKGVPVIFDFLTSSTWIVWLALILIFGIVEIVTVQFLFLMLAAGSLAGLGAGLVGVPWWGQVLIAAAVSLLLIFAVRPSLVRRLGRGGDPTLSNIEALVGLTGIVTTDYTGNVGHVKLSNGEIWTARVPADRPLVEGERVIVAAIEGATAVVVPVEGTES